MFELVVVFCLVSKDLLGAPDLKCREKPLMTFRGASAESNCIYYIKNSFKLGELPAYAYCRSKGVEK